MPSWSATESWRAPRRPLGWNASEQWSGSFKAMVVAAGRRLDACLREWDRELADIGGDPSRDDWGSFRPLRLSREEDWSDWLAHLLESSQSGRFTARLFAGDVRHAEHWRVSKVDREVSAQGYRADLVVHFRDESWAHVEIKVGDLALKKTPATTSALKTVVPGALRGEYVLLPAEDVGYWNQVKEDPDLVGSVDAITTHTWSDCARALRASVLDRNESLRWRVWAATFLGAVEQQLLGFQQVGADAIALAHYRPGGRDVERLSLLEGMLKERS